MGELLGDRIRKVRQEYGMSQAELARRIGVSKNAMNLIETNKTPDPSASKVKAIADVLWVSTDYLLGCLDDDATPSRERPRRRTATAAS
jgi:transcriptional regulator with XRE-family HTH domain